MKTGIFGQTFCDFFVLHVFKQILPGFCGIIGKKSKIKQNLLVFIAKNILNRIDIFYFTFNRVGDGQTQKSLFQAFMLRYADGL
jgi:hypothetical protein